MSHILSMLLLGMVAPAEEVPEGIAAHLPTSGKLAPCGAAGQQMSGSASFVLVEASGRRRLEFAEGNLVFCRRTSAAMTWIRFAESPANDGADGPHLDIDVCHLSAGGEFAPMEARAQPCPGGMTWAAWWHAGPEAAYASTATATPCTLSLVVNANRLRGTFTCRGLVLADGSASVDLIDGRFECVLEEDAEHEEPVPLRGFASRQ